MLKECRSEHGGHGIETASDRPASHSPLRRFATGTALGFEAENDLHLCRVYLISAEL